MVVLSFPPVCSACFTSQRLLSSEDDQLFGAEIVQALCGVLWGPGIGFGIVAFGTLLGEILNF
jgi:hypothetical protein